MKGAGTASRSLTQISASKGKARHISARAWLREVRHSKGNDVLSVSEEQHSKSKAKQNIGQHWHSKGILRSA